jgi:hypothetical protein
VVASTGDQALPGVGRCEDLNVEQRRNLRDPLPELRKGAVMDAVLDLVDETDLGSGSEELGEDAHEP